MRPPIQEGPPQHEASSTAERGSTSWRGPRSEDQRRVGLSVGTVHNRIRSEINARVAPLADELLEIELDRLDRWLVRLDAQIESGFAVARNVEVAIRVSERRSKLLGLDAPVRSRVETVTLDMIDEQIAQLEAELAGRDIEDVGGG